MNLYMSALKDWANPTKMVLLSLNAIILGCRKIEKESDTVLMFYFIIVSIS